MKNLPSKENRNHQSLGASNHSGPLSSFEVTFEIDQISNNQATLISEETGKITWPTKKLPSGHQIGDTITLKIPQKEDGKCCEKCTDMEHLRQLLEELVS